MSRTKRSLHAMASAEFQWPTKKAKPYSEITLPEKLQATGDEPATNLSLLRWKLEDFPGGDVFYLPEFVDPATSREWYNVLQGLDTWYHPTLKVYGKTVMQSRSIAAYATSEAINVKYSGHQVIMHYSYPEILAKIQVMVEENTGVKFNHVMLNKYENGTEYIGKHRDTKENNVIASLSLGAERTFILSPNKTCPGSPDRRSLTLRDGSLLIMQGDTQKNWKHEIPKEPKVIQGRISLTFRQLATG